MSRPYLNWSPLKRRLRFLTRKPTSKTTISNVVNVLHNNVTEGISGSKRYYCGTAEKSENRSEINLRVTHGINVMIHIKLDKCNERIHKKC